LDKFGACFGVCVLSPGAQGQKVKKVQIIAELLLTILGRAVTAETD
jgi:hypothetical protein